MKKIISCFLFLLTTGLLSAQVVKESTAFISQLKIDEYVDQQIAQLPVEASFKGTSSGKAFYEIAFFEGGTFDIKQGRAAIGYEPGKQVFLMEYDSGKIILEMEWSGDQHNITCKIKNGTTWKKCATISSSLLINDHPSKKNEKRIEGTLDFTGKNPLNKDKIRVLTNFYFAAP